MPFFLANWYLLFGLAAAIPVALHLLHKRKPQPVPFSTLRFLQDAIAKTRRSRHLTNFLTLLMRVLLLLLLALAFAQPQVRFASFIPAGPRTVVIVLDGSASMRFRDGEETLFDRAKEWIEKLIGSLSEADQVAVLMPGVAEPRVAFPPVSDHKSVLRAVRELAPGYGKASLAETMADLVTRLDEVGKRSVGTEVHVFSDFQASGWNEKDMDAVAGQMAQRRLLLFLNHVRPAVAANAGIAKAAFYPPAVLGDGEFEVRATVRSSREYRGPNSLKLSVQSGEQNRVAFDLLPDQVLKQGIAGHATGSDTVVMGELELEPDGFADDNVYRFCLPRLPGIPVLLVDGGAQGAEGKRDTFFLRHAIQPRGKTTTLFVPTDQDWTGFLGGDLEPYRVVFVCNPPEVGEAAARKLEAFARAGGTVVLMPGQNRGLAAGVAALGPLRGLKVREEELPQEQNLALVGSEKAADLEKRLLSVMPAPAGLVIRRRLVLSEVPAEAAPAFHFAAGGAFAVQAACGQGWLWVVSVSANRDWSEWPLTPFFVLFQQELIKGSVRSRFAALTGEVGSPLAVEWLEEATELDFRMRDPSGRESTVHVTRPDASKPVVIPGFAEPGFHRLERAGREVSLAANLPEAETELRYLLPEELTLSTRQVTTYQAESWAEHQENLAGVRHGKPLWPFLLCLAFLLAVTEELFANLRSKAVMLPEALRQFVKRGGRAG
jgi:hypothetical protein